MTDEREKTREELAGDLADLQRKIEKLQVSKDELLRTEEALEQIRRQKEAILSNIPDMAWLKDRESRFLAVNEPFEKACGMGSKDLFGKTDLDIWPRELAERYRADDQEVMRTGQRKRVEEPLVVKDGASVWIETIKTPIFNERGEIIGTTGIARDITDRKRVEEALRESEEKYRSVIDNVKIGIAVISPEMRVLTMNKQMREWNPRLDLAAQPVCYASFNDPPRQEICSYCPTFKTLKDGQVYEGITQTPSGGQIRNFKVISSALRNRNGKVIAAIEIVEDITNKLKAEEALKESEAKLRYQTEILGQKNAALREILEQIEIEKKQIKDNIMLNVERLLLPIVDKLRISGAGRGYVALLKKNLKELVSSFGRSLTEKSAKLTPREIEICNMVKNGLSSKEIAHLLSVSPHTVEKHRLNIRKKLGIVQKNFNLTSFLQKL